MVTTSVPIVRYREEGDLHKTVGGWGQDLHILFSKTLNFKALRRLPLWVPPFSTLKEGPRTGVRAKCAAESRGAWLCYLLATPQLHLLPLRHLGCLELCSEPSPSSLELALTVCSGVFPWCEGVRWGSGGSRGGQREPQEHASPSTPGHPCCLSRRSWH